MCVFLLQARGYRQAHGLKGSVADTAKETHKAWLNHVYFRYRQADGLKGSVADTAKGTHEAWINRQHLQDLYQKLLVLDLEYALDKKVEQEL